MNSLNVSLTKQLLELVDRKVSDGFYQSASEVVREGLRLLQDRDQIREFHREEIRKKIQVGIDQIDQGQWLTLEEVMATLRSKHVGIRERMGK